MNDSNVAFLLNERVKELECHNRLSLLLSQANLELDDLLSKTAVSVALRIAKYIAKQEKDAALQKSENLYRSILNSLPDAVTITDLDGTIHMASPSASILMGVDPNDSYLIGHNIFEFVWAEDRENIRYLYATGRVNHQKA